MRNGRSVLGYLKMVEELVMILLSAAVFLVVAIALLPVRLLFAPCDMAAGRKTFKSVLITGASTGIGKEWALLFAKEKARLVLVARSADKLEEVAAACRELGSPEVIVAVGSVGDRDFMENTIAQADDAAPLDLVIANAGYLAHTAGLADPMVDGIYPALEANVAGTVNTVLPAAVRMRARKSGQIAIVSSIAAYFRPVDRFWASYSATKSFQLEYGVNLRDELRRDNVGVSVLCPGYISTQMTDAIKAGGAPMLGMDSAESAAKFMKGEIECNRGVVTWGIVRRLTQSRLAMPPLLADYVTPVINAVLLGRNYDKIQAFASEKL